jgi:hypothetical protein
MRFRGSLTEEIQEQRAAEDIRREVNQAAHVEGALASAHSEATAERDQLAAVQKKHGVEPFDQLPKLRPLIELRRAFANARRGDELETSLLHARAYAASNSAKRGRSKATIATFEAQLQEHRALVEGKAAPKESAPKPDSGLGPEIDLALSILFEDQPVSLPTKRDTERLTVLADRRVVFDEALRAIDGLIEKLRSEVSAQLHDRLHKAHGAVLIELYRAAQGFARAIAAERQFRAAITGAGYLARPDLTPQPLVAGAGLVLGGETAWESQISEFRRFLEARKLV